MDSNDFLINRYLPRTDFESYDDFKKNYSVNVPFDFNFAYDIIDEWAKNFPDKKALYYTNDHGVLKEYTFKDISLLSNKTANALRAEGIKKGDTVLMMLKQRAEVWITIIALHKLGAVVIPATFQLTPHDISYRCESAKCKMIIMVDEEQVLKHVADALPECTTVKKLLVHGTNIPDSPIYDDFLELIENASDELERVPTTIDDKMLIYFSSGTTGMPKMILHNYDYPLGHIVTAKYWHHVEDGSRHLTVCDSGWAKFAWGKIYGQWICGAEIVAYDDDKFVPENLLRVIREAKLTTFCAPPTIYRFLIKEDLKKEDFASIHHCTIAGEPLNPEVYNKFYELTGHYVHEGFGQTETSVILGNFGWDPIKPGSTGKPAPLYDIDLVDDEGNSCEDGVVGSIVIRNLSKYHPTGLFQEYYEAPETNARSFTNDWYNTGDTAWRDSDGYFWFEGRNDDVIKCSGYRIGPFEVESALMTHPSVLECAVTAAPDPVRGQVVKATIVLTKNYQASEELKTELQTHVKNATAPYKYPRIIEFVKELPKTTSGKIKRCNIRQSDSDSTKS